MCFEHDLDICANDISYLQSLFIIFNMILVHRKAIRDKLINFNQDLNEIYILDLKSQCRYVETKW